MYIGFGYPSLSWKITNSFKAALFYRSNIWASIKYQGRVIYVETITQPFKRKLVHTKNLLCNDTLSLWDKAYQRVMYHQPGPGCTDKCYVSFKWIVYPLRDLMGSKLWLAIYHFPDLNEKCIKKSLLPNILKILVHQFSDTWVCIRVTGRKKNSANVAIYKVSQYTQYLLIRII